MSRVPDAAIAVIGLVLLSPVLALIAIAILLESGRPVLFRQTRVGQHGRLFQILKFRSMFHGRQGTRITAASDPRVTNVGRVLRRFKLDEIPQLWNVVRGEMALVGPRPEVPTFVDLSSAEWKSVLSVRPGITELASLVYREEEQLLAGVPEPEEYYRRVIVPAKLSLNLRYIRERTPLRDLQLIWFTALSSGLPGLFDSKRITRWLSAHTTYDLS